MKKEDNSLMEQNETERNAAGDNVKGKESCLF